MAGNVDLLDLFEVLVGHAPATNSLALFLAFSQRIRGRNSWVGSGFNRRVLRSLLTRFISSPDSDEFHFVAVLATY